MFDPDRDIDRDQWAPFLAELAQRRMNRPTSVEVMGDGIGVQRQQHGLLLRSLDYDARHDRFSIGVAHPTPHREEVLEHTIDRPQRILVDGRAGITPDCLAVDDSDGNRTLIRIFETPALSG